jgi:hypothetical protein
VVPLIDSGPREAGANDLGHDTGILHQDEGFQVLAEAELDDDRRPRRAALKTARQRRRTKQNENKPIGMGWSGWMVCQSRPAGIMTAALRLRFPL